MIPIYSLVSISHIQTDMGLQRFFPRFEAAFRSAGFQKPANFFIYEHNYPFKPDLTKPNVPRSKHEFSQFLQNHQEDYKESHIQRLEAWSTEAKENSDTCKKEAKAAKERGDYDTYAEQSHKQAIWSCLSESLFDEKRVLSSYIKWWRREVKERFP